MSRLKPYSVVIFGVLLFCAALLVYSRMVKRIPRGEWGGTHIQMNVGERSATIEFDCAHGEISGPLNIDEAGKFQLRGTFKQERGGPIRADDESIGQEATYSGEIKGTKMTLTLKVSGSDETETFTLERGKPGGLFKCK